MSASTDAAGRSAARTVTERTRAVIDCDVHNNWSSAEVLLQYLPAAFREYLERGELPGPRGSFPAAHRPWLHPEDFKRADAVPPGGGPAASDYEFLCDPHDPWEVPRRFWDRYDFDAIDPPAVPPPPLGSADPHSRRLRQMYGIDASELTEEQIRTARHGYCAVISYVDEKIGQLLETLETIGLADETTVVLTSDHGEMLGERGLWFKMSFLEPSARVPLIVRPAGRRTPRRIGAPVSLLDLVPTLVEAATGHSPEEEERLDGSSFHDLLDGEEDGGGRTVVAEYLAEGVTEPAVMIRRGRHKFIACPGDPDLLYDLEADPHELEDLSERPELAGLVDELRRQVTEHWDVAGLRERVLASQDERRRVVAALKRGVLPAWDHEPRFPASEQYIRTLEDMYELQRRARLDA